MSFLEKTASVEAMQASQYFWEMFLEYSEALCHSRQIEFKSRQQFQLINRRYKIQGDATTIQNSCHYFLFYIIHT